MKALGARSLAAALLAGLALATGCGGGGGGSTGGSSNPPPPTTSNLSIITPERLPGALQGAPYSTTLIATGGVGTLRWSIAPTGAGVTISESTGVLSGTPSAALGTYGVDASVSDSVRTVRKTFFLTIGGKLAATDLITTGNQYAAINSLLPVAGGVPPLSYTVREGALPAGVTLDLGNLTLSGHPLTAGVFQSTVVIQDSYSPPQSATMQVNMTVLPPRMKASISLPSRILLNRPVHAKVVVDGGTPPYTFWLHSGRLPLGVNLPDATTGEITGAPTIAGEYAYTVRVSDAGSPPNIVDAWTMTTVSAGRGRNDSIQKATPLGNSSHAASISPYIDPAPTATAGDQDFYKVIAFAGKTVHVETSAKRFQSTNALDTVLEIVDGNGQRLNWCNPPNNPGNFSSPCINDDISATPHLQDSALDLNVPGTPNTPTPVYVHVLDWRGDARPDMSYAISVSGALDVLDDVGEVNNITSTSPLVGALGVQYWKTLQESGGVPPYVWSVTSGALPPGLALSGTLLIGTPTQTGNYEATITATDSAQPPQTSSMTVPFLIEDPPLITTSTLPDAYTGQPYQAQLTAAGGKPPYYWNGSWPGSINLTTGVLTGPLTNVGTYQVNVWLYDSYGIGVSANIPLNIKPGPLVVNALNLTWVVGATQNAYVSIAGGTQGYTCKVIGGALPPGVTLASQWASCYLWGPATVAGSYTATILVTDSTQPQLSATTTATFTITP